ncbi:MAG TPA: antitoxin [Micromonosporaceae bacterium]
MTEAFKKAADRAKEKMGDPDKAKGAVEAAGRKIDETTGGRHADKIEKGQQMAREQIEKRSGPK